MVAGSGDLPTAAVLTGVAFYAWLLGRRGQGIHEVKTAAEAASGQVPLRSRLATSGVARRVVRFRMRDGALMRCAIADSGGLLSVYADRDYEIPGVDWSQVNTVVDIGAHVGSFSVWAARRAPRARCLAVEPNPRTFGLLQANLKDNGLDRRVTAINAAIGPAAGSGRLELVDHSLGTRLARSGAGEVSVRVETLSALLEAASLDRADVLKIDCEGSEYDVFARMDAETFGSIKTIACEYHPEPGHDVKELDALLERQGFAVARPNLPLGVLWAVRPSQVTR